MDLFAGVPVRDFEKALGWYERLFGSEPSFVPHAGEAVWELADHQYVGSAARRSDQGRTADSASTGFAFIPMQRGTGSPPLGNG